MAYTFRAVRGEIASIASRLAAIAMAALMPTLVATSSVVAQSHPGASETEIRIGNVMPYTGPLAAYGDIGRTLSAYFEMVNANGGVNGRDIRFISYDDAYQATRSIERVRQLVEQDDVLLIFQSLGLPALAVRDYLNENRVPQLFAALSLTAFEDPENYPWSMRWNPSLASEAHAIAAHLFDQFEGGTVGVLYQNDDFGAELRELFDDLLSDRFTVVMQPYAVSDPTVDSQISALQAVGADIFLNMATPRAAAQAIRRAGEIGWAPYQVLISISSGIEEVLVPAGLEHSEGIVTIRYLKDPADPDVADEPDVAAFHEFWEEFDPSTGEPSNTEAYAVAVASALVEVLRRCGDDLSRENVMRQATSLVQVRLPMLMSGIHVDTSSIDYAPIEQFRLATFDGARFAPFGELIDTSEQ